jgi:hypothetical protein
LDVHVFLSSINPKAKGEFIPEVSGLFPNQEVFAREVPSFDAFEMFCPEIISLNQYY